MNRKGFTLIELLAVIIILGILMLIAVPSITIYINNSRKEAYIATAKRYTQGIIPLITEHKLDLVDTDITYYIPNTCIELDGSAQSPYGNWKEAYVLVAHYEDENDYYWMSVDETGVGIDEVTLSKDLAIDKLKTGIDDVSTDIGIGNRSKIVVYTSDCDGIYEEKDATSFVSEVGGPSTFTMTYDNQGGEGCISTTGEFNQAWGELCVPTKKKAEFIGWYTLPNDGGKEITSETKVDGALTAYAKWEIIPDFCVKATAESIHHEKCTVNTDTWCNKAGSVGYNNEMYYGQVGTPGVIAYGDAYECDVDDSGTYDNDERFYVVNKTEDTVSLIWYGITKASYDVNKSNKGPISALSYLPKDTEWKSEDLLTDDLQNRRIQNASLANTNIYFTYTGTKTRLLTATELNNICGINSSLDSSGKGVIGELSSCNFLFESTRLATGSTSKLQGFWLENVQSTSNGIVAGGDKLRRYANSKNVYNDIGVKPVITVSINRIEY